MRTVGEESGSLIAAFETWAQRLGGIEGKLRLRLLVRQAGQLKQQLRRAPSGVGGQPRAALLPEL